MSSQPHGATIVRGADINGRHRVAIYSADERYRYYLSERIRNVPNLRKVAFVLLNPSTATETQDDPTVAKCLMWAEEWGYDMGIILNAYAYRATDPRNMKMQHEPIGVENDAIVLHVVKQVAAAGGMVICGWGRNAEHLNRGTELLAKLRALDIPLHAVRLLSGGVPGHPLYLRSDTSPFSF